MGNIYTGIMGITGERKNVFKFIYENFKCVVDDGDDKKYYHPCIDFGNKYVAYIRQPVFDNKRYSGNAFYLPYNCVVKGHELCIKLAESKYDEVVVFFDVAFIRPDPDFFVDKNRPFEFESSKYEVDLTFHLVNDDKRIVYRVSWNYEFYSEDDACDCYINVEEISNNTLEDWLFDTHVDHFTEYAPDTSETKKMQIDNIDKDGDDLPF